MNTHTTGRLIAILLVASGICLLAGLTASTLHAATTDTPDCGTSVKAIKLNTEDIDGDDTVKTIEEIIATIDASIDGVIDSDIS